MITDYATLKTSIAGFLHNSSSAITAMIPEFIADAEARIYNDIRIKAMETAFTDDIAAGVIPLPAGFLEWRFLYVNTAPVQKLDRKDVEWIYQFYPTRDAGGIPKYFAREGENLIFAPYPDSTYTVNGIYYKRLAALSDSNTTNWLIENAPDVLRYGALCEAAVYMIADERIPVWEQKFEAAKRRIMMTDKKERFSGSVLTMTAG